MARTPAASIGAAVMIGALPDEVALETTEAARLVALPTTPLADDRALDAPSATVDEAPDTPD